jgi:hypothetical protein
LDNKKNSLVTAIKILYKDQKCKEPGQFNAVKRQRANCPAMKNNSSKAACTSGMQIQNHFLPLSETDNNDEDTLQSQKRPESGSTSGMTQSKQNKAAPKKSTKSSTINTTKQYSIITDSDTVDGDTQSNNVQQPV